MTADTTHLNPTELGEKLKRARLSCGLTQGEVAERMGFARTTLVAIEKGTREPPSQELLQLAEIYGRSVNEWMREDAGEPSDSLIPQFRMPSKIVSVTEIEALALVSELDALARDYVYLEGLTGLPLPRSYPPEYDLSATGVDPSELGEEVAQSERARLGLADSAISDLRGLLEDAYGLRIFYIDMPSATCGVYGCNRSFGACVAINRKHPPARRNWSLAHECGHFLTTRHIADFNLWNSEPWGKVRAEQFADSFAKNFLMPRSGVNRRLSEKVNAHKKGVTVADVMWLANLHHVSAEAMFLRLEELKRLPRGKWDELKSRGFKPGAARQELGFSSDSTNDHMLPQRYRTLAGIAYEKLEAITEGQLARILRTDRVSARLELERLRYWADQGSDDGFDPFILDPDLVVAPA